MKQVVDIRVNELLGDPEASPRTTNWIQARIAARPDIKAVVDYIADTQGQQLTVAAFQSSI